MFLEFSPGFLFVYVLFSSMIKIKKSISQLMLSTSMVISVASHVASAEKESKPLVWMMPTAWSPNGKTFRDLFEYPDQWKETRGNIDVIAYCSQVY